MPGGRCRVITHRRVTRERLIAVSGRLIRHVGYLVLRLPPGHYLLPEILTRLRQLLAPA